MMEVLLASLRLWDGRIEEAYLLASRAREGFRAIGDPSGLVYSLGPLTRALAASGRTSEAERALEEARAGRGPTPGVMLGLAGLGLALHAGYAERALAEGLLARESIVGDAGVVDVGYDALVGEALALALLGREDAASERLAQALDLQPGHPYAQAVGALVAAAQGRTDEALDLAAAASAAPAATYLDLVQASLAAGLAATRIGRPADAALSFATAREVAEGSGDVVTRAFVDLVDATVAECRNEDGAYEVLKLVRARLRALEALPDGWESLARRALGLVDVEPVGVSRRP
jgi:hypothetical protein